MDTKQPNFLKRRKAFSDLVLKPSIARPQGYWLWPAQSCWLTRTKGCVVVSAFPETLKADLSPNLDHPALTWCKGEKFEKRIEELHSFLTQLPARFYFQRENDLIVFNLVLSMRRWENALESSKYYTKLLSSFNYQRCWASTFYESQPVLQLLN